MRIGIAKPQLGEQEISEVNRVIKSGMIASGPETLKFEEEFAEFIGCEFACAVNNGTAALSLALSSVGIKAGDEVITTPLTFVATANSIISCGAKPVFGDVDERTFNLSPDSISDLISEKTKAIMPVHLYGLPAKMDEIEEIAEKHDLKIIGDAAQAHGASINQKKVGNFGDVECFSFYPTKNMTTGEGGMVTTNNSEIYNKLNSIRNHGRPDSSLGVYEHERFGLNLRLTDIGSAIGRVQLRKLDKFNSLRSRNAEILTNKINNLSGIITPIIPKDMTHSWHQYTIRTPEREDLSNYLKNKGIGTGKYYPRLISDYPHLEKFSKNSPIAKSIVEEVISLPIHPGLSIQEVGEVGEAVHEWGINKLP